MNLKSAKGFTIVELLIVIVVIAILAAISIVAYTGVQDRARNSAAMELANQFAGKIRVMQTLTGSLPTDITSGQFNGYTAADHEEANLQGIADKVTRVTEVPASVADDFTSGNRVYWVVPSSGSQTVVYRDSKGTDQRSALTL